MMDEEDFYIRACNLNFGEMGERVLYLMRNIVTIHESDTVIHTISVSEKQDDE